jgi:hypothetical protein
MGVFWKLFTIAWGYVAGSLLASSLDPKNKKKIKKIKEEGGEVMQFLLNDFVETHKKLLDSAKQEVLTPENTKLFEEKKKQLMTLVDSYTKQAKDTLIDLKENGIDSAKEWVIKMEEMYEEQKTKIEELKEIAPVKASELKNKLLVSADKLKKEVIKKVK